MQTRSRIPVSWFIGICSAIAASSALPAEQIGLDSLHFLVGEWRGVGDGKWGSSAAERQYKLVFGENFIRGHGRSVYPRQDKNREGEIHESLDMYSFDQQRQTVVLRQFDNEGFVTTYYLDLETGNPDLLIFESAQLENVPLGWKARVTFERKGTDEFHEYFHLDKATGTFERYITNRFLRISD